MRERDEAWFDDAAGPLVRPYALTRGRTRSTTYPLDMITLVIALPSVYGEGDMEPEYAKIVRLCRRPHSVAEISARLDLPLAVVKVLISDLIDQDYVIHRSAAPPTEIPDIHVLQAVLDGIRKL
jgi:hypothetical protein